MVQKPVRFVNEKHVQIALKLFEFESSRVQAQDRREEK